MKPVILSIALAMLSVTAVAESQYSGIIEAVDKRAGSSVTIKGKTYKANHRTAVKYQGQVLSVQDLRKGLPIRYSLSHEGGATTLGAVEITGTAGVQADERQADEHQYEAH